jgi:hypothetical protein
MKISVPPRRKATRSAWLGGIAFLLSLPLAASAERGGDFSSVLADQAHMKATLKTTQAEAYTVHEIQAPSGTAVREYVISADLLFSSGDAALPGLSAPGDGSFTSFDWGLPFFFGRNVYTSIAGKTAPGGATPYWAYPPN